MLELPPPPPPIVAPCPAEARELHRAAQCGYVVVPLDRTKPAAKSIRVYYERYPRRNRQLPRVSTVVSVEGGPGYPVTPDRAGRVELWQPLSARRDLVLVDLKGTEERAARLRRVPAVLPAHVARAGRCATQIGPQRYLHSTSQAVRDIEAVLRSLHAGRIDLYGDSYGTYAAQAYALRFPGRSRSLTLDAAYPLPGTDPAWTDLVEAIRLGLELSCSRSPGCPAANPVKLATRFADRVREEPIVGVAPDGDGTPTNVWFATRTPSCSACCWATRTRRSGATCRRRSGPPRTVTTRRSFGSRPRRWSSRPAPRIRPTTPRRSTSPSLATTTRSFGISRRRWQPAAPRPSSGSPPTPRARSRPSAPRRGRARTTRASLPACAGPRPRGRTRPTRPVPSTRTSPPSCSTATSTPSTASSGAREVARRFPGADVR